jgi:hypothetical protein
MSLPDQPQDTIVKYLEYIEKESTWKVDIQNIIDAKFKKKTPFEIRKAIYGAYAIIHRERTEFFSALIEKQNAFLESAVGIPFRLEFVLYKQLAYELGALILKDWDTHQHPAQTAIKCTVMSLSQHGFGRVHGFNAANYWEQNHRETISDQLMLYLRGCIQTGLF